MNNEAMKSRELTIANCLQRMHTDIIGVLRGAHKDNQNILKAIKACEKVTIGRDPASDMIIGHNLVAVHHCVITSRVDNEHSNAVVYLTDRSVNGTYINGKLIGYEKTVILFPGCLISFGSEHITFVYIQNGIDQSFDMIVQPGALLYGDKRPADREINLKITHQMIGHGRQATVYLAYESSSPRYQVACRVTKRGFFSTATKETEILKSNRHINVLSMIAQYQDPNNRSLYSIFPLYTGGTLREYMTESEIEEKDGLFIFKQLLFGLAYIHGKGIIHCDIKPENVLLAYPSKYPRAIISDFGLSMFRSEATKGFPESYGTLRDHAPECLRLEPFDEKVDCWAAGIILYWMLSGYHPFFEGVQLVREKYIWTVHHQTINSNKGGLVNSSAEVKYMITKLLKRNSRSRWSAQECLDYSELWNKVPVNSIATEEMMHDFQYERYMWFADEPETQVDIYPRSDTKDLPLAKIDERTVTEIRQRRGADVRDSLFRYRDHAIPEAYHDRELVVNVNKYRYPKSLHSKR